jgi:D-beta-D-heptose 7-phosphate kinase/D-beta-D-heptose 1-phosphate adenosyltransferase
LILERKCVLSSAIAVVGDAILDHYVYGSVTRISPEAPVPVLKVDYELLSPGGSANVAASVQALNFPAVLFCVLGADSEAKKMTFGLDTLNVKCDFTELAEYQTTLKTRIMSSGVQITRYDRENQADLSPNFSSFKSGLSFKLNHMAKDLGAIIVSDYNKGAVSDDVRDLIQEVRNCNSNIKLFVDAKPSKMSGWVYADCVTPNFSEACSFLGLSYKQADSKSDSLCESLCKKIHEVLPNLSLVVITRAQNGCSWYDSNSNSSGSLPAFTTCKSDVIGAGDTFVAALAVAVCENKSIQDALVFANAASALAVSKPGTSVVYRMELDTYLSRPTHGSSLSKLMTQNTAISWARQLRTTNEKIVFANGCFDLLHAGHVHLLEQAKFAGGYLLVGVTDDDSVKKLKGAARPVVGLKDRLRMIAALECVDAVVPFSEHELVPLIEAVKPSVLVKGSEYEGKEIPGASFVKASGGEVLFVDMQNGICTTNTIACLQGKV